MRPYSKMKRTTAFAILLFFLVGSGLMGAIIPGHYVVELTTPSVAEQLFGRDGQAVYRQRGRLAAPGLMASASAESHRRLLRSEQQGVRRRIEAKGGARVHGAIDTVANALFVELAGEGARAQLLSIPGVKRVLPAREFHRVMDRAVLVNRIADAWAQIGAGRAGEGIKVGVIDTGIEAGHPAFRDESLRPPAGFPRFDSETDALNTNGKVIVARSYVSLLSRRDPDPSSRDRVGHGTALAAIIAGVRSAAPLATVSGVAPRAYIGSYKVFGSPNINNGATDAAILKAIDDAVSDGMDVINLSLGSDFAPRLGEDLEVEAIERATKAGVVVVVSAGNNGPGLNTIASPGTAPSAITVGAVTNDRVFAANVEVPSVGSFVALAGSGPPPAAPVTSGLVDVEALDTNGLACQELPPGSMLGRAALILRGTCTFETKLNNAQRAGAVAAVLYATEQSPAPIAMDVGGATLPAEMVSHGDGLAIKSALKANAELVATLRFTLGAVARVPGWRSSFSAAGPNVDVTSIKPDLVAVGSNVYTPTQTLDPAGDMYSSSGYLASSGTSFSAPIVAGAVALIKSARPGLTPEQYRSLIVNTASDALGVRGEVPSLQQTGAGLLDALAALNAPVTAAPSSLGFGAGGDRIDVRRTLTLANLGASEDTFTIDADLRNGTSAPAGRAVTIAAGGTAEVAVNWSATGLSAGTHEGFLVIRSAATGAAIRVPYWYAVKSPKAAAFTILDVSATGRRGTLVRDALLFRMLDAAGLNVEGGEPPEVTVVAGDGTAHAVVSYDEEIPGMLGLTVQLGPQPGANTFRVQAGEAALTFTITGQ